jgi:HK97 family phage major capsid protein
VADLQRAYSLLTVKAVDTERRTFAGMATTPTPDRVGDIVDPLGARFKNPLPLLLFHDTHLPVGTVTFGKATDEGIPFEASIPDVVEPGTLKDRVDEAWHSVKYRIMRAVSIGFRAFDDGIEMLKGGGLRFTDYEVLELSLVPVPANAEATITSVKSIDAEHLAASGLTPAPRPTRKSNTPGVSGTPAVRLMPSRSETQMQSTADQIVSYKSTRDQKFTERDALMSKASEEGRTLDAAESESYETLDTEIKSLDTHITRLEALQAQQKASATAVVGHDQHAASASRGAVSHVSVKSQVPPGIEFARAVICKALAYREGGRPIEHAKERYPDADRLHAFLKATVPGGTTTHVTYAAPLVDPTNLAGEFIEFLRPETIVGKFGTGNYPSLRRVPFNVRMNGQTSGGDAYWVGEGAPKPLTKFDFSATTLGYTKIASIAVLTDELVRFSSPSAEALVRDALVAANVERADVDFIDPSLAAVANVSPASITNGLTALAPSGTSADAARSDIARIIKSFLDENNTPASMVLIMPMALALSLSVQVNSLGQPEFPGLTMRGGTLLGIPVITSQYAANRSGAGNLVIAVNASDVFLADDGQVTVDVSREASLQMLDNPTNSSATGTATSLVSMFQTNSMAIRAERYINWAKRRASAVVYMDDVNWGSIGSPS